MYRVMDVTQQRIARRLRTALVQPIPAEVAVRHLAAMRRAGRRSRRWPSVLAVAAALLVGGGALALPGQVDLPDVVDEEHIPEHAPGAPTGVGGQVGPLSSHDSHGETVSDIARNTTLAGREKGEQVSEAAASKSLEHRKDGDHRPTSTSSGSGGGEKPEGVPAGGSGRPDGTPGKGPGGS